MNLEELLTLYAVRGIADWVKAQRSIQDRARRLLRNQIAENRWAVSNVIKASLRGSGTGPSTFIPMPKFRHKGIDQCFFLPIREPQAGKTAFDLLLFVDESNTLGFRFEPADSPESTHGYGHVQLNRSMCGGGIAIEGIPKWLPETYPAFAIGTSDPVLMFLSMATSVHGYENGMQEILVNMWKSRPHRGQTYIDALRSILIGPAQV